MATTRLSGVPPVRSNNSRRNEPRRYHFVAGLIRCLVAAVSKPDYRGAENLPATGGFIAASNHVSEVDGPIFSVFLYNNGREPRVLAKRALFTTPVVRWVMRSTRMIPVDRGSEKAASSLAAAAEELRAGACVAIFPEGTLTRDPDCWPMEAKTGIARIALDAGLPVIPVAMWGQTAILGRYRRLPKPFPRKRVAVLAGPPVDLADLYGRQDDHEATREATSRIMDAITNQLGELRGEIPPAQRFDLHLHPEYKAKMKNYPPVVRP